MKKKTIFSTALLRHAVQYLDTATCQTHSCTFKITLLAFGG